MTVSLRSRSLHHRSTTSQPSERNAVCDPRRHVAPSACCAMPSSGIRPRPSDRRRQDRARPAACLVRRAPATRRPERCHDASASRWPDAGTSCVAPTSSDAMPRTIVRSRASIRFARTTVTSARTRTRARSGIMTMIRSTTAKPSRPWSRAAVAPARTAPAPGASVAAIACISQLSSRAASRITLGAYGDQTPWSTSRLCWRAVTPHSRTCGWDTTPNFAAMRPPTPRTGALRSSAGTAV